MFCYIVDGMFISKLPMEVGNDGNLRMIQKILKISIQIFHMALKLYHCITVSNIDSLEFIIDFRGVSPDWTNCLKNLQNQYLPFKTSCCSNLKICLQLSYVAGNLT